MVEWDILESAVLPPTTVLATTAWLPEKTASPTACERWKNQKSVRLWRAPWSLWWVVGSRSSTCQWASEAIFAVMRASYSTFWTNQRIHCVLLLPHRRFFQPHQKSLPTSVSIWQLVTFRTSLPCLLCHLFGCKAWRCFQCSQFNRLFATWFTACGLRSFAEFNFSTNLSCGQSQLPTALKKTQHLCASLSVYIIVMPKTETRTSFAAELPDSGQVAMLGEIYNMHFNLSQRLGQALMWFGAPFKDDLSLGKALQDTKPYLQCYFNTGLRLPNFLLKCRCWVSGPSLEGMIWQEANRLRTETLYTYLTQHHHCDSTKPT